MPEVIVVGDIDTDQFYIVPHLPAWDEGVLVDERYECPGGKGGNTAAALSILGIHTGILASMGDDRLGRIALEGLRSKGVDVDGIAVVRGGQTYYCVMMLDESGEKALLVVRTDLIYPTFKMIEERREYLASGRHAHFICIDPARMSDAICLAKELGLSVSIDLDAAYQGLEACKPAIVQADVVFVNRQGAERLFPGRNTREVAEEIQKMGPSIAVVTAGSHGAVGVDGSKVAATRAFKVKARDTTGAGDVFSGAFVFCYLQGRDLEFSLNFASAAAALSTLQIGGQTALHTEAEVLDFLERHSADLAVPLHKEDGDED